MSIIQQARRADRQREIELIKILISEGRYDLLKVNRKALYDESHPHKDMVHFIYMSELRKRIEPRRK